MIAHAHTWTLINSALRRYRCVDPKCNAVGYAPVGRRRQVIAYLCQFELGDRNKPAGRTHCSAPATHVGSLRTQHRCAEHAPQQHVSSAAPAA